ncbi:hypothetical protein [Streptomyces sp. KMM 9044]|uniref:hypothetical protein n=1 Tax=Streptomyces sp. KMM 9044 TaxID=2744474 RepID=UPI0021509DF7|nr:hypothetical protein [Streptomyces sp. KMM 9044]WAX76705.1 hypothetical protein HUV60_002460 [Streptomyces sp. KMM 9044]
MRCRHGRPGRTVPSSVAPDTTATGIPATTYACCAPPRACLAPGCVLILDLAGKEPLAREVVPSKVVRRGDGPTVRTGTTAGVYGRSRTPFRPRPKEPLAREVVPSKVVRRGDGPTVRTGTTAGVYGRSRTPFRPRPGET